MLTCQCSLTAYDCKSVYRAVRLRLIISDHIGTLIEQNCFYVKAFRKIGKLRSPHKIPYPINFLKRDVELYTWYPISRGKGDQNLPMKCGIATRISFIHRN